MPTTTDGLPYPAITDDVDVVGDLEALALAVDGAYPTKAEATALYRTIADSYAKAEVYLKTETYTQAQVNANLTARVVPVITGGSKLHFGTAYVTPAVGGKATIAHGAGFTPDQVFATAGDTDSAVQARKGMTCNIITDEIGGTNFAVRVYRNDTAASVDSAVRIVYICRQN